MDKQTQILVACTHEDIMAVILRLINSNAAWHGAGAKNTVQAKELLKASAYDLLLLGNGLSVKEEEELSIVAKEGSTKVVKHYGGGSGLLFGEIHEALRLNR